MSENIKKMVKFFFVGIFMLVVFMMLLIFHESFSQKVLGFSLKNKIFNSSFSQDMNFLDDKKSAPIQIISKKREKILLENTKNEEKRLDDLLNAFISEKKIDPLSPNCLSVE